jgi:hypothetical protein
MVPDRVAVGHNGSVSTAQSANSTKKLLNYKITKRAAKHGQLSDTALAAMYQQRAR